MACNTADTGFVRPSSLINVASAVGTAGSGGTVSAVSRALTTDVLDVSLEQSISPSDVLTGQCVTCTITLRNNSSVPLRNVRIAAPDLVRTLDIRSVSVNGRALRSGCRCRSISVPTVDPGGQTVVTLEAVVPSGVSGEIASVASADFTVTTSGGSTRISEDSNTAVLTVDAPGLEIEKTADRDYVTTGGRQITYTLTVRSTGGVVNDVVVTDVLPEGLTYVAGSTRVNGRSRSNEDPADGISLGTLRAGESTVITFRARASV